MIEVKRKDRESSENLIRRFSRRVQQSGILKRARKIRFQVNRKSKSKKRQEALYKVRIRKEIDKLKKMDRFNEETLKAVRKKVDNKDK